MILLIMPAWKNVSFKRTFLQQNFGNVTTFRTERSRSLTTANHVQSHTAWRGNISSTEALQPKSNAQKSLPLTYTKKKSCFPQT